MSICCFVIRNIINLQTNATASQKRNADKYWAATKKEPVWCDIDVQYDFILVNVYKLMPVAVELERRCIAQCIVRWQKMLFNQNARIFAIAMEDNDIHIAFIWVSVVVEAILPSMLRINHIPLLKSHFTLWWEYSERHLTGSAFETNLDWRNQFRRVSSQRLQIVFSLHICGVQVLHMDFRSMCE